MKLQDLDPKWGKIAGLLSMLSMLIIIPILMIINPEFSKSFSHFDPLSQLGSTSKTENIYRALLILCGILALIYFEIAFIPNRPEYERLYNWNLSKLFMRLGVLGQILTGIYDERMFPEHLFATILFAIGYVSGLAIICFDLANQMRSKGKITTFIHFGLIISILATLNTLYFRYSTIRGIWQFFIVSLTFSWYFIEANRYPKVRTLLEENIKANEIFEVTKYSYVMLIVGLYLILFAYLLYSYPSMEPWACTENDQKCDMSNVISLIFTGSTLLLFLLLYQIKAVKKYKLGHINMI